MFVTCCKKDFAPLKYITIFSFFYSNPALVIKPFSIHFRKPWRHMLYYNRSRYINIKLAYYTENRFCTSSRSPYCNYFIGILPSGRIYLKFFCCLVPAYFYCRCNLNLCYKLPSYPGTHFLFIQVLWFIHKVNSPVCHCIKNC